MCETRDNMDSSYMYFCFVQQGFPVFAVGVGLSTFDKASVSLLSFAPYKYGLSTRPSKLRGLVLELGGNNRNSTCADVSDLESS